MASNAVFLTMRLRWWVKPYLQTLVLVAVLFGREPDFEKVGRFLCDHGIIVEATPCQ